jgi:hypothetical protein
MTGGGGGGLDFLGGKTSAPNFGGIGFQDIYGGGGLPGLSKLNTDFSPSIFFPTDK